MSEPFEGNVEYIYVPTNRTQSRLAQGNRGELMLQ
jgi:hypothetical protein